MDEKIKLLMEELDCDKEQAEMLLQMSGGNIEEAIHHLEKNRLINVLQAKFWLKAKNIYGLFFCLIDPAKKNIYRSNLVFAYNPQVFTVDMNEDWLSWDKLIYHFRLEGADEGKTHQYNCQLLSVIEKNIDLVIRRENKKLSEYLLELFMSEDQPVVEITVKEINLAQYRFRATEKENIPAPATDSGIFGPIVLEISAVSDEQGIALENLVVDDLIWVEITDRRDIAYYLAHLLSGRDKDVVVPLPVPIRQIIRQDASDKTTYRIEVSFTEWVKGQAVLTPPLKVKAERKEIGRV